MDDDEARTGLRPLGDSEVQCIAIGGLVAHRQVGTIEALRALERNPVVKVASEPAGGAAAEAQPRKHEASTNLH